MRPSIEQVGFEIAKAAASRSEDPFRKVGCAIFNRDNRLLSIGYNGLRPKQITKKNFWENRDNRRDYVIHAETNALSCISRYDDPYLLISTLCPCKNCAVNISAHGIKKVLYLEDYEKDKLAKKIFKFYNIEIIKYENKINNTI